MRFLFIALICLSTAACSAMRGAPQKEPKAWSNVKYDDLAQAEYDIQTEIDKSECISKAGLTMPTGYEGNVGGGIFYQMEQSNKHAKALDYRNRILYGCMLAKGWRQE